MKRYLIFMFPYYYPSGGLDDFVGDADTKEDAFTIIEKAFNDWTEMENLNILDTNTGKIIKNDKSIVYNDLLNKEELSRTLEEIDE